MAPISRLVQQQNVLYEQDYFSPHVVPVEGEMQEIPLEGEELDDPLEGEEHLSCIRNLHSSDEDDGSSATRASCSRLERVADCLLSAQEACGQMTIGTHLATPLLIRLNAFKKVPYAGVTGDWVRYVLTSWEIVTV